MVLSLQAYGDGGYESRLDHAMSLARYLEGKILQDGHAFVLVHPRSYTNVCFYWIPPSMRPFCLDRATDSEKRELGNVRAQATWLYEQSYLLFDCLEAQRLLLSKKCTCFKRLSISPLLPWLQVAPRLKSHMQAVGDAMIGFQPLGSWPNFFRIVFASAWNLQVKDLDLLLKRMDDYGTLMYSK